MNNKDLIAQYVDTGLQLAEYQVIRLPNWALKTYLRKRLIAGNLIDYEFKLLDDANKWEYLIKMKNKGGDLQFDNIIDEIPKHFLIKLINLYIKNNEKINYTLFTAADLYLKQMWINVQLNREEPELLPTDIKYMDDKLFAKFMGKMTPYYMRNVIDRKIFNSIELANKMVKVGNLRDKQIAQLLRQGDAETIEVAHILGKENINKLSGSSIYWILLDSLSVNDLITFNKMVKIIGNDNIKKMDANHRETLSKLISLYQEKGISNTEKYKLNF